MRSFPVAIFLVSIMTFGHTTSGYAQGSIQDQINQQKQNYGTLCQQSSNQAPGCGGGTTSAASRPAAPAVNPAATAAAGAIGYAIGQQLHNALFGNGTPAPVIDPAAQQQELAAQELNNSGLYLLKQKNYAGAINEFQQALIRNPHDADIQHNLDLARQQQKNTAVAGQNSASLSSLLGGAPAGGGAPVSSLNLVNLNSSGAAAPTTPADPASLQNQLDGVLSNHPPAPEPPDPLVEKPQASDIDLLFQPPAAAPSAWPGPQRPANEPKLVNPLDAESNTASTVNSLDSVLGTKSDADLSHQMDQFNKDHPSANPALPKLEPAAGSAGPHN